MPDVTDDKIDSVEQKQVTGGTAMKEVDAGRGDLVQQQKQHTEFLKDGGKSGITKDFDKPTFYDSSAVDAQKGSTGEVKDGGPKDPNAGADTDIKPGDDGGAVENKARVITVDESKIKREKDGAIKEIDYPDGTKTEVQRDKDGHVNKVKTPDGTWVNDEKADEKHRGHWSKLDKSGKKVDECEAVVVDNKFADVRGYGKDDRQWVILSDGTRMDNKPGAKNVPGDN